MTVAGEVVQRQLDAYNARDLEPFMATYSETVKVFRMPATEPALAGKEQLAAFYATRRFNLPDLHAAIVNRTVLGNKVFDHERVSGVEAQPFEAVAVYEVIDGLIQTVWFFSPA